MPGKIFTTVSTRAATINTQWKFLCGALIAGVLKTNLDTDKLGDNVGNKNIQNKTMKNIHHYYDKEWTKKWNISLKRDHVIRIQTRKGTGIHCSDHRGRNGGRRTWTLQILINYIWWPFKSVMNYNLLYFSSYINNNLWILYTK